MRPTRGAISTYVTRARVTHRFHGESLIDGAPLSLLTPQQALGDLVTFTQVRARSPARRCSLGPAVTPSG